MPTETENQTSNLRPSEAFEIPEPPVLTDEAGNQEALDDTPEYPLSAPMKPDDPERRSEQSKAETAGLIEEELPALPVKTTRPSFKLALGSAMLIAISLGFELGRQVARRR